jgi:hypothetical protein
MMQLWINIENGARHAGGSLPAHVRGEPCYHPKLYKLLVYWHAL